MHLNDPSMIPDIVRSCLGVAGLLVLVLGFLWAILGLGKVVDQLSGPDKPEQQT